MINPPATTTRALCRHCGATPGGCASLQVLGGKPCCKQCAGDHDREVR